MAQATAAQPITVGVDTRLDRHVAHANDRLGRRVGTWFLFIVPAIGAGAAADTRARRDRQDRQRPN